MLSDSFTVVAVIPWQYLKFCFVCWAGCYLYSYRVYRHFFNVDECVSHGRANKRYWIHSLRNWRDGAPTRNFLPNGSLPKTLGGRKEETIAWPSEFLLLGKSLWTLCNQCSLEGCLTSELIEEQGDSFSWACHFLDMLRKICWFFT